MKLELLGVKSGGGPFVEIDDYVPLTIQWPGYTSLQHAPKCLMLDAGGSLIEVKVDAQDGEVVEVILVDSRGLTRVGSRLSPPSTIEVGIPMIGITHAAEEEVAGGIKLHEDGLDIRFYLEGEIARSVGTGGVLFGFAEQGELLGVSVKLEPTELFRLDEALR